MFAQSLEILKQLQYQNGLFAASHPDVKTGYHIAWLRDNIYITLGLEAAECFDEIKKTINAIFDILQKHEYKIDLAIKEKPKHHFQYIHPRYDPLTLEELPGNWGNKQNDSIGALLFRVGELQEKKISVIRDENDLRILQKLVHYLASIEYWHDKDSGMWEENEELHASSVGACVAGLKKIKKIVDVPEELIAKGEESLNNLLPNESETKKTDMALLSLIYPYNVVTEQQAERILRSVEEKLVRGKGVIRYIGDKYYYKNGEAMWTKGFPWLALVYSKMGRPDKYALYMRKATEVLNKKGELPELYYADGKQHNENTPLAWSQSLFLAGLKENRIPINFVNI